jgi:hypothetical protein
MSDDFLSRWSRLKRASSQPATADAGQSPDAAKGADIAGRPMVPKGAEPSSVPAPPEPLPPVESLSFDSDFTAFMKPEVDGLLKRQALKTLFQDPRFNVMDGLDVYIDDFSKADPLPEGWLEKMTQVARLGDYEPPAEEAPADTSEEIGAAEKELQKEALATPERSPPSDTLELPTVPPQVTESRPPE